MSNPKRKRIAVLMSGGVDSSVAALLLKREGHDLVGLTLVLSGHGPVEEAAAVCGRIGIPHSVLDLSGAFEEAVLEPFRESYRRGQTPSPCVECNAGLKFGLAWDLAKAALHVDAMASGHYARTGTDRQGPFLARGADRVRDQSYFLYALPLRKLACLLMPLGSMEKAQVRTEAAKAGLSVSEKPDSMDLCFAGQGDYRKLLKEEDFQKGPVVSLDGRVLGEHRGLAGYTVGQRKGLGVAFPEPLYVARIDRETNTLVVAPREALLAVRVTAFRVNVLKPQALEQGNLLFGKIRSTGEPSPCRIARWEGVRLTVDFDDPVFAPAPGQKLVLYDAAEHVVAGGTIQAC
jgi:tRNA-specific 2-thiouridylase